MIWSLHGLTFHVAMMRPNWSPIEVYKNYENPNETQQFIILFSTAYFGLKCPHNFEDNTTRIFIWTSHKTEISKHHTFCYVSVHNTERKALDIKLKNKLSCLQLDFSICFSAPLQANVGLLIFEVSRLHVTTNHSWWSARRRDIYLTTHNTHISFSSLSYDRSKACTKVSSLHSAIHSFLFQMRVSSPFLKVIQ
jgi:hypothetical protein